jgi:predicted nucleotidyltransferase
MKFGLKEEVIQQVNKVFADFPDVEEVILYGSRAKGKSKPGSDIDLTLKGKNLNQSILNSISLQLDNLFLPYTFDLSIFVHIDNKELIEHIKRVGIVIYSKEPMTTDIGLSHK